MPSIRWMKANTDGPVTSTSAACGGLFHDYMTNFRGGYAKKIRSFSLFHAELMTLILTMEVAHSKNCHYLWLESDSLNALRAFDDMNVVPWNLRNRWSNCLNLGLTLKWSHIFREGNTCADKLANFSHNCTQMRCEILYRLHLGMTFYGIS
jgi:ribonuclease HI